MLIGMEGLWSSEDENFGGQTIETDCRGSNWSKFIYQNLLCTSEGFSWLELLCKPSISSSRTPWSSHSTKKQSSYHTSRTKCLAQDLARNKCAYFSILRVLTMCFSASLHFSYSFATKGWLRLWIPRLLISLNSLRRSSLAYRAADLQRFRASSGIS